MLMKPLLIASMVILNITSFGQDYEISETFNKWKVTFMDKGRMETGDQENTFLSYNNKLKISDAIFENVSLVIPKVSTPYYILELAFIDDASDDKISLFNGVPYCKLYIEINNQTLFEGYPLRRFKKPIIYPDIPLRAMHYVFRITSNQLNSICNQSSQIDQITFKIVYGLNKEDNWGSMNFSYSYSGVRDQINKILRIRLTPL